MKLHTLVLLGAALVAPSVCLRTNSDKASPGCKDALSKLPQRPPQAPPAQ